MSMTKGTPESSQLITLERMLEERDAEIDRLCEQRDAWKEIAEHQYGLLRIEKYGHAETGYAVTGALDSWAAGRHPVLSPNVEVTGASGAFAAKRPCGPQG